MSASALRRNPRNCGVREKMKKMLVRIVGGLESDICAGNSVREREGGNAAVYNAKANVL